jgi:hypothetical protein
MGNLAGTASSTVQPPALPTPVNVAKSQLCGALEPVVVAMSAFVSNRARHVRSRRKFLLIALTTAIVLNLLVMWILW